MVTAKNKQWQQKDSNSQAAVEGEAAEAAATTEGEAAAEGEAADEGEPAPECMRVAAEREVAPEGISVGMEGAGQWGDGGVD